MVSRNSSNGSPAVDNFDMGQIGFALGIVGNHKAAGLQTEPGSQDAFDKQVEIGIQLELEDRIGSGAYIGSENQVELEKQQSFECPVEQAQTDVLERTEAEPSGQKVDPFSQKVELAGYWVVLAQLWVVLMSQMAEQTGQLVGLVGFEADQFVQMVD